MGDKWNEMGGYKNTLNFRKMGSFIISWPPSNGRRRSAAESLWLIANSANDEATFIIQGREFTVLSIGQRFVGGRISSLVEILRRVTGYRLCRGYPTDWGVDGSWDWISTDWREIDSFPRAYQGINTQYFSLRDVVHLMRHRKSCPQCHRSVSFTHLLNAGAKETSTARFLKRYSGEFRARHYCSFNCFEAAEADKKANKGDDLWLKISKNKLKQVRRWLSLPVEQRSNV